MNESLNHSLKQFINTDSNGTLCFSQTLVKKHFKKVHLKCKVLNSLFTNLILYIKAMTHSFPAQLNLWSLFTCRLQFLGSRCPEHQYFNIQKRLILSGQLRFWYGDWLGSWFFSYTQWVYISTIWCLFLASDQHFSTWKWWCVTSDLTSGYNQITAWLISGTTAWLFM